MIRIFFDKIHIIYENFATLTSVAEIAGQSIRIANFAAPAARHLPKIADRPRKTLIKCPIGNREQVMVVNQARHRFGERFLPDKPLLGPQQRTVS